MAAIIPLNRGSDLSLVFAWPADLTGYTVEVFEPSDGLADHLSAAITDAAEGEITVTLTWDDSIKTGAVSKFRIRVTSGGGARSSTNEIRIDVA